MNAQHGQSTQSPGKQVLAPLTSCFGKDPALGRSPRTPWEFPQADTALLPLRAWEPSCSGCPHPGCCQDQLWLCQTGPNSRATG